jgi:predicted nucleic acid-binding protein
MKRNILLDTGVLLTFINKREKLHPWTKEQWKMTKNSRKNG